MEFNYYYGDEADQFSFIRIPKLLLTGEAFADLSLQAKVLYGLLLDRMGLSVKNHWLDDDNRVFIIYQIAEIQEDLGYSKKKAMGFLGELETMGLVEKRKRGFGLPSIIYVKNFIISEMGTSRGVDLGTSGDAKKELDFEDQDAAEEENSDDGLEKVENESKSPDYRTANMPKIGKTQGKHSLKVSRGAHMGTSRGVDLGTSSGALTGTSRGDLSGTTEVPAGEPLKNNTKYINTYLSNTESNQILSADMMGCDDEISQFKAYQEIIRKNLELDIMLERYPFHQDVISGIYDLILEVVMSKSEYILISSDKYPTELVKSKMLKLNSSHLEYVLDCMASNTTKVRNIKKYLLATLFNAPTTMGSFYQSEVNFDMPQYARQR